MVLDAYKKPVIEFRMPLTISPGMGMAWVELSRRMHCRINNEDIVGRINHRYRDPFIKANALNMRLERWRRITNRIAWSNREMSASLEAFVVSKLTLEQLAKSSTMEASEVEERGKWHT